MKAKYAYLVLMLIFAGFTTLIIRFARPESKLELKMRNGEMAATSEWINIKKAIEGLITEIKNHPDNRKAKLNLALAYIQESRITGEHAYYDKISLQLLDEVIKKEPENVDALCSKATVLLSQHHFADAVPFAKEALKLNPYNSGVYGIMTDAYVELGNYGEAIKIADKMASVRPDLRSYSRISYLREIHGDYNGAIEAMKLAVSAGYPGLEQTAWVRTCLGHLYEVTGDLENARMQYFIVLTDRPEYAFALAGLGRVEKAKGNYPQAIAYLEKAKVQLKDFSFDEELTELYRISNQPLKASEHAYQTIEALTYLNDKNGSGHGHYADRELAYACLNVFKYDLALTHALIEYNRRPDNIDVNQTLAWVYFKLGKYKDANKYMETAMRTGSQNPTLLYQAGLIKMRAGEREQGIALMNKATHINPFISPALKWERENYIVLK